MHSSKTIHIVSCHAEGEVGDVIVDGVAPPPGESLWEMRKWIEQDNKLRNFVLNEPRGGVFRHVNLLVPPKNPKADMGFIIMEPEHTPPMSGSNAICVATVLLERGILPMYEPVSKITLEAPGGLVAVEARCEDGKAKLITLRNVASFVGALDQIIEVENLGSLKVHTAYGGDSFVMVDAKDLGFEITADEAKELAEIGTNVTRAANEQLGFRHPTNPDWKHISFCQIADKPTRDRETGSWSMRNTVVIDPGKLDRSPTGTGVCARMAVLHAQGKMGQGEKLVMKSVIDSTFIGEIAGITDVNGKAAIIPKISGRGWITGTHQYMLDPEDPWPEGYRLTDTWPKKHRAKKTRGQDESKGNGSDRNNSVCNRPAGNRRRYHILV